MNKRIVLAAAAMLTYQGISQCVKSRKKNQALIWLKKGASCVLSKDLEKAEKLFKRAASQTIDPKIKTLARMMLAKYYIIQKEPQKALVYLEQTTTQTHTPQAKAEGLVSLGNLYYFGKGIKKDHKLAKSALQELSNTPELIPSLNEASQKTYNVLFILLSLEEKNENA